MPGTPAQVEQLVHRKSVTALELLARRGNRHGGLSPTDLQAWLVGAGLAVPNGRPDRLVPTRLAIEIGGALAFLGSAANASDEYASKVA